MRYLFWVILCYITVATAIPAQADEPRDTVLVKLFHAYGGEAFVSARSMRITDQGLFSEKGYGYHPELYEYDRRTTDLMIDWSAGRASYDYRIAGDRFAYHNRVVSTDNGVVSINYALQSFELSDESDLYSSFGSILRRSDTALAYVILKNEDRIMRSGSAQYLGRQHDILDFDFPKAGRFKVFVRSDDGLITRMEQVAPTQDALTYLWSDHKTADGIAFAALSQLHVGDHLESVVHSRRLTINALPSQAFAIASSIKPAPSRGEMQGSSHVVIAPGVYLTGLDGVYSLFVEADDFFIASGLNQGFAKRFELLAQKLNSSKPLRYAIAAQHAEPHIGGIPDAINLGAILVAPRSHLDFYRQRFPEVATTSKLLGLEKQLRLGPVLVYSMTTTSSDHLAVPFVPSAGLLFQTDSYGAMYDTEPGFAGIGGVALKAEISRFGLAPRQIAFVYHAKPEPYSNFIEAVGAFVERPCFPSRPICFGDD